MTACWPWAIHRSPWSAGTSWPLTLETCFRIALPSVPHNYKSRPQAGSRDILRIGNFALRLPSRADGRRPATVVVSPQEVEVGDANRVVTGKVGPRVITGLAETFAHRELQDVEVQDGYDVVVARVPSQHEPHL